MEATETQVREKKVGHNRTGIQASPLDSRALERDASNAPPPAPNELRATEMRADDARNAETIGSVPPPATLKGIGETALQGLQGHHLASFIDKLGERLAFERSGVRVYEALLVKFDALGSWDGGPTRDLLQEQCDEELRHFHLMQRTLESLGADPTAMTPSADLAAVEASGLMKVLTDPRTTMKQVLHSLLVIEGADADGWQMLAEIASHIGQEDLASEFRSALATEETHKQRVREWLTRAALAEAQPRKGDEQRQLH